MPRKQGNKKRKIWYRIVADALQSQQTFSIIDNVHGSKCVYEEIVHYLLRDCTDTEKCKAFNYHCRKVKGAFARAVAYLESKEIPVRKTGRTNRIFDITLDPAFPNAKQEDYSRTEKRMQETLKSARAHIQLACPRLESRFNKSAQKLLLPGQGERP